VSSETAADTASQPDLAADLAERARSQEPGSTGAPGEDLGHKPRPPSSLEGVVMSLAAKGLANSQISAHLAEVYDTSLAAEAVGKITDTVLGELADWQSRPLDPVYPVVFIDAMVVKIRDGKVANRPVHTAIGITIEGSRDILGLWVGEGGEGAKYWHQVLTEISNRGVNDVCFLICDGLKGLPDAANAVWPQAIVQTCVVHLIRNSLRYASHNDRHLVIRHLRPIYTAPTEQAATERLADLRKTWAERYPAIIKLWENAWPEFVPFLAYSPEIREVIYTTNAIENLHSRLRQAVRAHGYFHTEQAALKCLYLSVRSLDPTGLGQSKWSNRWKAALNAFGITFEGRLDPSY
jgi:putative transposase